MTDRNDPIAIQAALDAAIAVKTSSTSSATTATTTTTTTKAAALLGWEACGKSAKQEARDYFEMIVRSILPLTLASHSCSGLFVVSALRLRSHFADARFPICLWKTITNPNRPTGGGGQHRDF